MLTVHHLNNSRSQRVLWLLEELGVEYRVQHYTRDAKTMLAPPELLKVHPLGKSPIITDGDNTVAESGAIIDYLVERQGKGRLQPAPGTPERLRYTYWMHYAEGSAMMPMLLKLIFSFMPRQPMPFFVRPLVRGIADKVCLTFVDPMLKLHLDFMEGELAKQEWFAGPDFTAADIQMSFPIEVAAARGGLDASRPRLFAFLKRVQARPAYRKALEIGGPYQLLS
ncbi:MAG: glutathione S-transferase [Pseudomonadota bacterium]